ncbi:hypothetical protein [Effusibacillus dendaii]|uniref:Uncharacterized protein n=1 Tax=Effusibacillus dendaii TaxID=2743772 RepID=A0A7I8DBR0_9BACL|nr:hypothetical protein [Effusibacillus dendaii]BCJ85361.1 hypothetical protein skT53_03460 [Effusibacillus dendaii]
MELRRPKPYEDRVLDFATKLERLFFRLAMLGFMGILASQLALSIPTVRDALIQTDQLENKNAAQDTTRSLTKQLTIRPAPENGPVTAWVKINNTPVAKLVHSQVSIEFTQNDEIEIDTSGQSGVYRFEIDHNDPSIASPAPGTYVETSESHQAVIQPVINSR